MFQTEDNLSEEISKNKDYFELNHAKLLWQSRRIKLLKDLSFQVFPRVVFPSDHPH